MRNLIMIVEGINRRDFLKGAGAAALTAANPQILNQAKELVLASDYDANSLSLFRDLLKITPGWDWLNNVGYLLDDEIMFDYPGGQNWYTMSFSWFYNLDLINELPEVDQNIIFNAIRNSPKFKKMTTSTADPADIIDGVLTLNDETYGENMWTDYFYEDAPCPLFRKKWEEYNNNTEKISFGNFLKKTSSPAEIEQIAKELIRSVDEWVNSIARQDPNEPIVSSWPYDKEVILDALDKEEFFERITSYQEDWAHFIRSLDEEEEPVKSNSPLPIPTETFEHGLPKLTKHQDLLSKMNDLFIKYKTDPEEYIHYGDFWNYMQLTAPPGVRAKGFNTQEWEKEQGEEMSIARISALKSYKKNLKISSKQTPTPVQAQAAKTTSAGLSINPAHFAMSIVNSAIEMIRKKINLSTFDMTKFKFDEPPEKYQAPQEIPDHNTPTEPPKQIPHMEKDPLLDPDFDLDRVKDLAGIKKKGDKDAN